MANGANIKLNDFSQTGRGAKKSVLIFHSNKIQSVFFRCSCFNNGCEIFDRREAISFNPDGFISFAGWADNSNVKPFIEAFSDWISQITESKAEYDARTCL